MTRLSNEKGERALALRYGALAWTAIMAIGLALMLLRGPGSMAATFQPIRIRMLFSLLMRLEPAAVTEFGILLLLFTPIFRLVVAAVPFALERDAKYVFISLGVLAVVLVSIRFAAG